MTYAVENLKTVAQCEQALGLADARKKRLLAELGLADLDNEDEANSLNDAKTNLIVTNANITGTTAALAEMAAGPAKVRMAGKLRRLNDRKENLEERLSESGPAALLDAQLDAGLMNAQVTELEAYKTAVTAKKATL